MHRRLIYFAGRCDHTHIASALWEVAREAVTEGFISSSTEIHGNRRREGMPPYAEKRKNVGRFCLYTQNQNSCKNILIGTSFSLHFFITCLVPCDFPSQKANTISE